MILANISDERFMTIDEIIRNIDNPDLTKGRIIKSLNNLVRMGVLEKRIKRIKGKKKTVFKALEYVDELQFEEEFFVEEKDPVYSQDALYLEDFEEAWWEE